MNKKKKIKDSINSLKMGHPVSNYRDEIVGELIIYFKYVFSPKNLDCQIQEPLKKTANTLMINPFQNFSPSNNEK